MHILVTKFTFEQELSSICHFRISFDFQMNWMTNDDCQEIEYHPKKKLQSTN